MAGESKVVSAQNENRVLFKGTEDACRDYVERNFPRHHADPTAPTMEVIETDVYFVGTSGVKEMYLGPEESEPWQRVKAPGSTGGKA
jgi:hypothetical protein